MSSAAIQQITYFITSEWPVLAKRKRLTFRVSYDAGYNVINAVPLGKQAPLSRCCMRTVVFVFTQNIDEGGYVRCTDPFCTRSTIDTFAMSEQLIHSLFTVGLRFEELPLVRESNLMESRHLQQGLTKPKHVSKRY